MKVFPRFVLVAAAAVLAVCASYVPAYADSQGVSGCTNCNGYTFQATLQPISPSGATGNSNSISPLGATGNSNYSLSYTITNVSGTAANPKSWSLTLFGSNQDIGSSFSNFTMSDSNSGAYSVLVGKSNNGNGDCNAAISNALCVMRNGSGAPSTIGAGQSLTFTFDFSCTNCTELSNWIFLASGTCVSGNGNCYAISTSGTPTSVPEPSSPTLLVCSLLAALAMMTIPRVRGIVFSARHSGLHGLSRI